MTQIYSCARTTRRWPLKMFFDLIDISALNAYVIWVTKFPDWRPNDRSRRQYFLRELATELVQPNVLLRQSFTSGFHSYTKFGMDIFNKHVSDFESSPNKNIPTPGKSRCVFCPRNVDRKTKSACDTCKKSVCPSHRYQRRLICCPICNLDSNN